MLLDHPIVHVYGNLTLTDEVEINWSAIGSVSIEEAKKFRQELDDAIVEAEKIKNAKDEIVKNARDQFGELLKTGNHCMIADGASFLKCVIVEIVNHDGFALTRLESVKLPNKRIIERYARNTILIK